MDDAVVGGHLPPKLVWLLKDVLPALASDARAAEAQAEEAEAAMENAKKRFCDLKEQSDAINQALVAMGGMAKSLGVTEQQLGDVVGEQMAKDIFTEVEF